MQMMRHPRLFTSDEIEASQHDMNQTHSVPSGFEASVPSVSGFAFACSAASLPLLMSRDLQTACSVADLLNEALPFIFEPQKNATFLEIERSRLQHLLNRMEQVLSHSP